MNFKYFLFTLILSLLGMASMQSQDVVELTVGDGEDVKGAVVCVDVTIDNFIDIASLEFALAFDNTVLGINSITANESAIDADVFTFFVSDKMDVVSELRSIGFKSGFVDNKSNYSISGGSAILYEVCFDLIGEPGDMSTLDFSYSTNEISFKRDTVSEISTTGFIDLDYSINNGKITILPDDNAIGIMSSTCDNILGAGGDDGSIIFMATPGRSTVAPFTWRIYNSTGFSQSGTGLSGAAEGLSPGSYTIEISDSQGNTSTKDVKIIISPELDIPVTEIPLVCPTSASGGFDIPSSFGLISNYNVRWESQEHNIVKYDTSVRGPAGTYTLYAIHKVTGCEHVFEYELKAPEPFDVHDLQSTRACSYSDGVVSGTFTGGTIDESIFEVYDADAYYIDGSGAEIFIGSIDGLNFNFNVPQNITDVIIKLKDTPGCSGEVYIDVPLPDLLAIDTTTNQSCNGNEAILIAPDDANYSYAWSHQPGETGSRVTLTTVAFTKATITDNDTGCIREIDFNFDNVISGNLMFDPIGTSVSCYGEDDGAASIQVIDESEWTFTWFNDAAMTEMIPGSTSTVSNLEGGDYYVEGYNTIENCTLTAEVIVPEPDEIMVEIINTTNVSCNGNDGSVRVKASGGADATQPYTFILNGSSSSSMMGKEVTFSSLPSGTGTITVQDISGCDKTFSFTIESDDDLEVELDESNTYRKSCNRISGQLATKVSGGTEPYTFNWFKDGTSYSNPNTDENILIDLDDGAYTLTVEDAKGCIQSLDTTLTITPIEPIEFNIEYGDIACYGETTWLTVTDVTGGSGSGYKFQTIGSNAVPINDSLEVIGNAYEVIVIDGDLCSSNPDSIFIDQPEEIILDAGEDQKIRLGETTDEISLDIQSQFPIDSIVWEPETYLNFLTGDKQVVESSALDDINYLITVYNSEGCIQTDDLFVDVNKSKRIPTPNAFSPNGDGKNDFFTINLPPSVTSIESFAVYNRFGNMLYLEEQVTPINGIFEGWDGKYNGDYIDPGVYVWQATYNYLDGTQETKSGSITLVR